MEDQRPAVEELHVAKKWPHTYRVAPNGSNDCAKGLSLRHCGTIHFPGSHCARNTYNVTVHFNF
jgi:hypothetical protein